MPDLRMPLTRLAHSPVVWIALHAALIVVLAGGLPPDAWFSGDSGVKLIATRGVLAHPERPMAVDIPPALAGAAAEFPQPFLALHGDHLHPMTPPLLPILTAPFVALFGLHGLYVLPALGWLVSVPLTARLARAVGARASPAAVVLAGIVASPLLFYGLELWEHAPAVAAVLGAAVLVFSSRPAPARALAAGACAGLAALLRPEAIWWAVAIASAGSLHHRAIRWVVPFGAGAGLLLAPLVGYNLLHFGSFGGVHVGSNVTALGQGWLAERASFVSMWFLPTRTVTCVLAWMLAAAHAVAWLSRRSTSGRGGPVGDVAWLVGLLSILLLMSALAQGQEERANLWRVFPAGLLALLPGVTMTPARRLLWILALLPVAGVLLTTGVHGGGQWGPRYILPVVPFLLILAIDSLGALGARFERAIIWLGFAAVVISLVVGRTAYRDLRGSKRMYADLAHDTAAQLQGASYVVTDVWWLGQMHAAVIDPDRILYVEPGKGAALLGRLEGPDVLLVQASGQDTLPPDAWVRGTCYRAGPSMPHFDGRLVVTRLTCK